MVLYKFDVSSFIYFSLDELFSCLFCFVVIIIIIKRKPEVLKERGTFLIIGLAVFALINMITISSSYTEYSALKNAYETGNCHYVEGSVTNFKGHPDTVRWYEEFEINDVTFSYSSAEVTFSYNKPKVEGGVIVGNGQKVRIGYVPYQMSGRYVMNRIVYIEQL